MTTADTTNETVIEILDRIDRGWQSRSPVPVSELLASMQNCGDLDSVSEVLAADSEWRWRIAGFNAQASNSSVLKNNSDRKPHTVEHYLEEMPELREEKECALKLIESEFLARSRWGNPPTISEFADRFPDVECLDQHLARVLDEHAPIWVSRESRVVLYTSVQSVAIQTPLVIGRCTKEERSSNWLTNGNKRLIIAGNSERGVSREHVRVTRVAIDRVLVVNISSQSVLGINGVDIFPGVAQQLLLPVSLDIGASRLRLAVW
ncbi:MAG: hypothetical protein ACK5PB_17370 [Pirellula sp.]